MYRTHTIRAVFFNLHSQGGYAGIQERFLFKSGLYFVILPTFAYHYISNDSYRACIQERALFPSVIEALTSI